MKEEWLLRGAVVPVDVETTAALVAEIHRLIGVVGGMVLAQPAQQEPVDVDQATMELAESVGLIGPASRTHDLHAAIQRFHDLICVNSTIKAAKMAVDVIRESTPAQRTWVELTDEEIIDVIHPLIMADMPDEATDYEIGFAKAELWIKRINDAVFAEREECAKVCDAWHEWGTDGALLAKAIRARRNA